MTKESIIDLITKHEQYKRFCKKLCKGNNSNIYKDMYQEFMLAVCECDEDKLISLYNSKQLEFFCLGIIFRQNSYRKKPAIFNPSASPLYEMSKHSVELGTVNINDSYNINIDINATKVLDYVSKDKTIKVEDWLLLVESLDRSLIDISKESGIPYITLKVKRKRLKDKIRNNVNI
jgi:hypothetical protein